MNFCLAVVFGFRSKKPCPFSILIYTLSSCILLVNYETIPLFFKSYLVTHLWLVLSGTTSSWDTNAGLHTHGLLGKSDRKWKFMTMMERYVCRLVIVEAKVPWRPTGHILLHVLSLQKSKTGWNVCTGRPWVFSEQLGIQAYCKNRRRELFTVQEKSDHPRGIPGGRHRKHSLACVEWPFICKAMCYLTLDNHTVPEFSCGEDCPIPMNASCRVGLSPDMIDFLS